MRRYLFAHIVIVVLAALAVSAFLIPLEVRADDRKQDAGIRLDESGIRAVLKNGSTVIVLPISNASDHTVAANVSLAWLNPKFQM